jgi:hypothetical protein
LHVLTPVLKSGPVSLFLSLSPCAICNPAQFCLDLLVSMSTIVPSTVQPAIPNIPQWVLLYILLDLRSVCCILTLYLPSPFFPHTKLPTNCPAILDTHRISPVLRPVLPTTTYSLYVCKSHPDTCQCLHILLEPIHNSPLEGDG